MAEIVAGATAGSTALQADALDFFGDAANYAISLGVAGMVLTWRARGALAKGGTLIVFAFSSETLLCFADASLVTSATSASDISLSITQLFPYNTQPMASPQPSPLSRDVRAALARAAACQDREMTMALRRYGHAK